jgi:hypothetical protein
MIQERALNVVLALVGFIFLAGVYPLTMFFGRDPALAMMLSLYVTLGISLLLAARNPSANRSLIAFTAWSSFVHASLMAVQAHRKVIERGELVGSCARCHWCCPDCAGSGKAVRISSRCVGSLDEIVC